VFLVGEVVFALGYALVSGADEALLYDSLAADGRAGEAGDGDRPPQARAARRHRDGRARRQRHRERWGLRAPMLCQTIPIAAAASSP
jgi:hypothetical protein